MNPTNHLTHEELSNLLIADPTVCDLDLPLANDEAKIAAHLDACATCALELQVLRESIAGFRDASILYAARQPKHLHTAQRSGFAFGRLAMWAATAAAAIVVAIAVPMHRQHPVVPPAQVAVQTAATPIAAQTHTAESDEALLASIDQDLSASVPSSMASLDNPLPSATNSTSTLTSAALAK